MPDEPETTGADEDVKARYKEALDRKHEAQQQAHLHPDGSSKVHEAHGPAGAKRQFRRRAGG